MSLSLSLSVKHPKRPDSGLYCYKLREDLLWQQKKRIYSVCGSLRRGGRDPDVSGSAAELSQRVMEWEEEAEAEHLPAVENDSDESIVPPGIGQRSERVLIRALRTLHICAIDPDSNRELDMVMAGNPARISQHDVDELIAAGLIIEL